VVRRVEKTSRTAIAFSVLRGGEPWLVLPGMNWSGVAHHDHNWLPDKNDSRHWSNAVRVQQREDRA